MGTNEELKTAGKEQMKALREARKDFIRNASARMKEQKKQIEAIKEQLRGTARTVPEIADAAQLESAQVLWWIATLKKYGEIIEGDKDDGYFRYSLVDRATCSP